MADPTRPLLLTYAEAGRQLGVSSSTIRRMIEEGKLVAVRPLHAPRIPQSEVDAFLSQAITEGKRKHEVESAWQNAQTATGCIKSPARRTGGPVLRLHPAAELGARLKKSTVPER